jgi:hypothetical protein
MASMFVISTTNITRSVGIIPKWFAILGFLVGVGLLLSASFNRALVLVFPIWILVFCALLIRRARRISDDVVFDIEHGTIHPFVQARDTNNA